MNVMERDGEDAIESVWNRDGERKREKREEREEIERLCLTETEWEVEKEKGNWENVCKGKMKREK